MQNTKDLMQAATMTVKAAIKKLPPPWNSNSYMPAFVSISYDTLSRNGLVTPEGLVRAFHWAISQKPTEPFTLLREWSSLRKKQKDLPPITFEIEVIAKEFELLSKVDSGQLPKEALLSELAKTVPVPVPAPVVPPAVLPIVLSQADRMKQAQTVAKTASELTVNPELYACFVSIAYHDTIATPESLAGLLQVLSSEDLHDLVKLRKKKYNIPMSKTDKVTDVREELLLLRTRYSVNTKKVQTTPAVPAQVPAQVQAIQPPQPALKKASAPVVTNRSGPLKVQEVDDSDLRDPEVNLPETSLKDNKFLVRQANKSDPMKGALAGAKDETATPHEKDLPPDILELTEPEMPEMPSLPPEDLSELIEHDDDEEFKKTIDELVKEPTLPPSLSQ